MREPNPINIRSIDHLVIRVTNLEAMVDFYCNVLGCRLERELDEAKLAQLRAGNSLIDLVDASGPLGRQSGGPPEHQAPNLDHFCLQVQPWDRDAIRKHLRAHDVDVDEIVTRYGATGYGPSLYIRDPEGNRIELKGTNGSEGAG
jgi:glyoxylase I family protein